MVGIGRGLPLQPARNEFLEGQCRDRIEADGGGNIFGCYRWLERLRQDLNLQPTTSSIRYSVRRLRAAADGRTSTPTWAGQRRRIRRPSPGTSSVCEDVATRAT